MRIPRLYIPQALTAGETLQLDAQPSHYLSKVLRLREGASLILFDGVGSQCAARITDISKKNVTVVLGETQLRSNESPLAIHLGIAVSRGERMDWVVQKATELGVAAITPLFTERTEVKLAGERADKKIQHWQQIAISACEQCDRNHLPVVNSLAAFSSWVDTVDAQKKWVLHHRTTERLEVASKISSVALLIGPEGGLSDSEIHLAQQQGFVALSLGPRVLRTETAPVAAIALLQYAWGDLG